MFIRSLFVIEVVFPRCAFLQSYSHSDFQSSWVTFQFITHACCLPTSFTNRNIHLVPAEPMFIPSSCCQPLSLPCMQHSLLTGLQPVNVHSNLFGNNKVGFPRCAFFKTNNNRSRGPHVICIEFITHA